MSTASTGNRTNPAAGRGFETTRWTAVIAAGGAVSPDSRAALEWLCATYWYPLYAWVRRQGYASHDAEDLIQGFFARFLKRDDLKSVDRARGKFRSYLLASLKHFVANQRDRARAQKRGGGHDPIPWDGESAATRYGHEPVNQLSADRIYDRRWAFTVLEQALAGLRQEYEAVGKHRLFEGLKECLTANRSTLPYADLAMRLSMTEGSIKVAVHRLRQRYRAQLRSVIAKTVASEAELEEELHFLVEVLRA